MRVFAKGWSEHRDGPGFRRIYYLKGCNLHCCWCASPESISPEAEMLFHPDRSEESDLSYLCPHGAITGRDLNRARCRTCPDPECRRRKDPALEWVGEEWTVEELREDLRSAAAAWSNFGGVTFGGGEPSLQAEELCDLLIRLRTDGIHTAFESNASTPAFPSLVRSAALTIADLKGGSEPRFRENTGGNLTDVLANLSDAAEHAQDLLLRIPLITGKNDSEEELEKMAEILLRLHTLRLHAAKQALSVEILKLHHFGEPKYRALGRHYELAGIPEPAPSALRHLTERLLRGGIQLQRNES